MFSTFSTIFATLSYAYIMLELFKVSPLLYIFFLHQMPHIARNCMYIVNFQFWNCFIDDDDDNDCWCLLPMSMKVCVNLALWHCCILFRQYLIPWIQLMCEFEFFCIDCFKRKNSSFEFTSCGGGGQIIKYL